MSYGPLLSAGKSRSIRPLSPWTVTRAPKVMLMQEKRELVHEILSEVRWHTTSNPHVTPILVMYRLRNVLPQWRRHLLPNLSSVHVQALDVEVSDTGF
jgi:hypothetical protein